MIRLEKKKVRKKKATVSDLTLDTGLIECGFTFGNRFRDFFSEQTGISPFKFNVDMVATAKSVKENGDEIVNGKTAEKLYIKYIEPVIGIKAVALPSTSPANAAWSLDRLEEAWAKEILNRE